ncbi:hypothetical protein PQR64_01345 [Paraburkholderia phytofirmans]|uniref:hypothetical protein n=1 Tax=Paraburkholderia phytofirmans TaxID=261302 RepID=UPI0038BB35DF
MPNAVAPRRCTLLSSLLRRNLTGAALAVSLGIAPLAYGADPNAAPGAGMTGSAGASSATAAATSAPAAPAASAPDDTFLLTIFLRHDESKPLPKINEQLRAQGFFKIFPPPGIEVVSWYVMMGIGQVVTLRVPASRLREVNRAIETTAWGGYRTEFYPTYDYKAQAQQMRATEGK